MATLIEDAAQRLGVAIDQPFFIRHADGHILGNIHGAAYIFKFTKNNFSMLDNTNHVETSATYYLYELLTGRYTVAEFKEELTLPKTDGELSEIYNMLLEPFRDDVTDYLMPGKFEEKMRLFGEEKLPQYVAMYIALEAARDKVCEAMALPIFAGVKKDD